MPESKRYCHNCKHWQPPYLKLMIADDAPLQVGHCVREISPSNVVIQGITVQHFVCHFWCRQPAEERADA